LQKVSNKQIVSAHDVTWATKYQVGKRIVQFNPVAKDVMRKEVEAQLLLNPDAHIIPPEVNPEIIPDKDDEDENIVGMWPAQNQNPVAGSVLNQNMGVHAAIVNPTASSAQNPNTGAVPQNVGGAASPGRVRTGGTSTVEKQLKPLQIDMADVLEKTIPNTVRNQVAAAVYKSDKRMYTEENGTTECFFNVLVNSNCPLGMVNDIVYAIVLGLS
jgi:hypothetical protein